MKFKVTLENMTEYEVVAENEKEAVNSVLFGPMYDTAESIVKTDDKATYLCKEVEDDE